MTQPWPAGFETLDSGVRETYASGMNRDTQEGKPRYDLIDRDFLRRWAELMARGAEKYGPRNWELAATREELDRFVASGLRHHYQYIEDLYRLLDGRPVLSSEDHAAAVAFNLAAAEKLKTKLLETHNG